ncbi:MAG: hypothetical protein AAGA23_13640 [Pseudomonadota bacterium]
MSAHATILASTWNDGLFVLSADGIAHELPGRTVRGLSDDLTGGAFAAVDDRHLFQRRPSGHWSRVASSEHILSVTFAVGDRVYVGTDDARVLVLDDRGELIRIDSFDSIEGRASWFAGTAIIDGKEVGPPLGIRSLSGAPKGRVFANVHVGGVPRSLDGGATWEPTIGVELDAHEVRVSPVNDDLVAVATAMGLCISWDGGETWSMQSDELHATYCSAVAVTADDIFVAASEHHFSTEGAIYRRSVKPSDDRLEKVEGGLPKWLAGISDTSCIACNGEEMALISAQGQVFCSSDAGHTWNPLDQAVPGVSSVLLVR